MNVCIGGTFDPLHKGHKYLIQKAVDLAGKHGFVFIGVTVDEMLHHKKKVASFSKRKNAIQQFLKEKEINSVTEIAPINDRFGPSVKDKFDAIVVSPETKSTAEEINKKRESLGKKPLKIVQIPLILAQDNMAISSTRIKQGEIDRDGTLVSED
jgi:pantetheine-phosphate adenylyltransferase